MRSFFLFIFSLFVSLIFTNTTSAQDTLQLTASKSYSPPVYQDADTNLKYIIARFKIPAEINVISGNAGNHTATLTFVDNSILGSGTNITITYKGGASTGNPTTPAEILKGKKYIFHSSSNGMAAGDSVYATHFNLKINNGVNQAGTTAGRLLVNHRKLSIKGTIINNGSGVPIDTVYSYTSIIPAFLTQARISCPPLLGNNLVDDGSFDNPVLTCADYTTKFTTSYACSTAAVFKGPGDFGITNDASTLNSLWSSPNSNGNFLAFDGNGPGTTLWQQLVPGVKACSTYCFSVRVRNIWPGGDVSGTLPDIALFVNGGSITTSGNLLASDDWITVSASYTAPANVSGPIPLMILLISGGLSNFGNDVAIDDISFALIAPPSIKAVANPPIVCSGQTVSLSATSSIPMTYNWTGNNITPPPSGTPVQATPAATSTYTVSGEYPAGCIYTANVNVLVNSVQVSPSNPTICNGSPQVLIATGDASYTWSPATNLSFPKPATKDEADFSTTTAGTYNYTVTGTLNSCSTSVTVTVLPKPVINASGSLTFCSPGNVLLSVSSPQTTGSYQWYKNSSPVGGGTSYTATTTGTYTVSYNGTTCTSNPINVVAYPNPSITVDANSHTLCEGEIATLTATDGLSGSTYNWAGPNLLSTNTATVKAMPSTPGLNVYTVTVTTPQGCVQNSGTGITLINPAIKETNVTPCPPQGTLVLVFPAPAGSTYQWYDNKGLIAGATGSSYNAGAGTGYYVKVTYNGHNCTSKSINVTPVALNVTVQPSSSTICQGQSVTLTASGSRTGYNWQGSDGFTGTGSQVTVTPSATTTYTVTAASNGQNCTGTAMVTVTVIPTPTITPSISVCAGQSITLSLTSSYPSGSTFQWFDQNNQPVTTVGTISDYTFTPAATGNYYIGVTYQGKTCYSGKTTVTVNPATCCAPAGAVIIPPGDLGNTDGTVFTFDASQPLYNGAPIVFSGNYHVRGSLQFKNGTFYLLPGTVFTIDQNVFTIFASTSRGSYIHVLDATLYLQGATLQPSAGPLPQTVWGGVVLQRSTIFANSCSEKRNKIENAIVGIQIVNDDISNLNNHINNCHYHISNTDFTEIQRIGIIDYDKSTVSSDEGISDCKFISNYWYNIAGQNYGIYLLSNSVPPGVSQYVNVTGNYFESQDIGIINDFDYATISGNTMAQVVQGVVTNYIHTVYHTIFGNIIALDDTWGFAGIVDQGFGNVQENIITGANLSQETGIIISGGSNLSDNVQVVNNEILNNENGIRIAPNYINLPNTLAFIGNKLSKNTRAIFKQSEPFTPMQQVDVRCNTIDNSTLAGTSFGIFVEQNAYLNDLGTLAQPNGNAFIGFKNVLNRFPMEYRGQNANTFQYFKSTSNDENFVDVTSFFFPTGGAMLSGNAPGCVPGYGVGFRIAAASSPLSAEDSVNAAMDSLRFQLGGFRKMKAWQGEILSYHEKNNKLDDLYSYCDSLKGCNLEAYNTFMLYLMNRYDHSDQCSKAHDCAHEVLEANPDDKEIQARTTYFNYECRQRHSGQRTFILPFMPLNPQDSTDLYSVANSETSLSEIACMKLRRHNPKMQCNIQNTYVPNYPDCGEDCKKKKNEFLKKGWEKHTGFKADKTGGQVSQNIPNPAGNETVIPYLIPQESFTSAYITIQSVINGNEVKKIELTQAGYNAITINLENLPDGVYTYTLVVDGIKQDVKRMVVVK